MGTAPSVPGFVVPGFVVPGFVPASSVPGFVPSRLRHPVLIDGDHFPTPRTVSSPIVPPDNRGGCPHVDGGGWPGTAGSSPAFGALEMTGVSWGHVARNGDEDGNP
ncbi:MAG: hypothetical protein WAL56_08320 [Candidatus Sulfotelmatobacter sp.]